MEQKTKQRFEKVEKRISKVEKILNREQLSKGGYLLKCRCGYSWITRSEMYLVSCTKCGNKVKNPELIKDKKKVKEFIKKTEKENSKYPTRF